MRTPLNFAGEPYFPLEIFRPGGYIKYYTQVTEQERQLSDWRRWDSGRVYNFHGYYHTMQIEWKAKEG